MKTQAKIMPIQKTWLSSRETKEYLDCSDDFLQKLRDDAQLSFSQIRGKYYYSIESINKMMIKNKII